MYCWRGNQFVAAAVLLGIAVGAKASRSLTITADHVKQFAEITGDYNPLHFDADFASRARPTTTSAARLSGSSLTSRFPSTEISSPKTA